MKGPLLMHLLVSKIVIGSGRGGGKPLTGFVTSDSLPAGTYMAVEQNGTICPELPRLVSFEMVVTNGGRGQLASFKAAVSPGRSSTVRDLIAGPENATLVWYMRAHVSKLRQFGSLQIGLSPNCFHVEPKDAAYDFLSDFYIQLRLPMPSRLTSHLVFCQTEMGVIVGIGRNTPPGRYWNSTLYGFRVALSNSSTVGSLFNGPADGALVRSKKRSSQFLSGGGPPKLAKIGKKVSDGRSSGSLDGAAESTAPELSLSGSSGRVNRKRQSTLPEFVTSESLPPGSYKAVKQNGTICPELPDLRDFEMVVTNGEEGQLVKLAVIAEAKRVIMEEALPVKWYSYDTVHTLTRLGSRAIEGDARCFHVASAAELSFFAEGLYGSLRQLREENPSRYPGSQLIFCYTNLGLMVGIGAEKWGNRWVAARYAFRIDLPGSTPTYDDICRVAPPVTSKMHKTKRDRIRREAQGHGKAPNISHHEVVLEPQSKTKPRTSRGGAAGLDVEASKGESTISVIGHPSAMDIDEVGPDTAARKSQPVGESSDYLGDVLDAAGLPTTFNSYPNGKRRRIGQDFVTLNSLPAGTYKAVEQNGTICPELPRLVSFEMVVTDGEEGQLVKLMVIAKGRRIDMEKASPMRWYSFRTVSTLKKFGSWTIAETAKCFHVEPPTDVAPFVEGLYRTLEQLQREKADSGPVSQLIFCYTNLGLVVGIDAEKTGSRWHATRYAFRIDLPGLPTYDDICRVAPSMTSRQKRARKRKQRELQPRSESREWDFHEVTFDPPPKRGQPKLAKISATAASNGVSDGFRSKTVVEHSSAMELDEVSPEARQSPPAKVFRDDSGERISPEADGVSPPSSLILMRDGEQESASDAGLYHARDAAGNYVGADLLSSSFDASNFGVRHDGAHDSSWESARSLVDSSGSGPGEWRAHDHHHHVVETGRPIARADDLISPPEFEDQWPGAEVRSKLERASTYEEWVEALLGAPDPEQPEGRTGEHHHDSERESSSASVDDLQFPFEFGDLRPDPEARSNDEWVEAIFDSAESIQSEGHTAEHHHEMDRGRTTEDEEDLSLPFELEDLWPEAEDRSSEEQWIKAFLAFPGASYPPSPAVPLTGEFEENYAEPRHQGDDGVSSTLTSIPDGKRLILNL